LVSSDRSVSRDWAGGFKGCNEWYDRPLTPEERLATIFVVSQIRGVPEAPEFLSQVAGQLNLELYFAQQTIAQPVK